MNTTVLNNVERISRCASLLLHGSVDAVFPLFGPLREMEWAEGWSPEVLFAKSEAEEKMIFRTSSRYHDEGNYLWTMTKFDVDRNVIEYVVSTKDRLWFITVRAAGSGGLTTVTVEYTYTGFTEEAVARNRESLSEMFREGLLDWQEAINHFLLTGKKLES